MKVSTTTPDLAATQRELWRFITAPDGVRATLKQKGDAEAKRLVALLRGDERLSPAARLEIYADAYFHRIHDCLRADFGALHEALGTDAFHDLVTAYLIACPPSHPSLRFAGARLPDFLAEGCGAAPLRRSWPWAADLATLEWALVDAFDAPDAPPTTRDELASLSPEDWDGLELVMHPALTLLALSWPVHRLREAHERTDAAPSVPQIAAHPTRVCVWRRDDRVFFRSLEALEAELLDRAWSGATFGALCAFLALDRKEAEATELAASLLARWLEDGLLVHGAV